MRWCATGTDLKTKTYTASAHYNATLASLSNTITE